VLLSLGVVALSLLAHARPLAQAAATNSPPLTAATLVLLADQPGADMTGVLRDALTDPDPAIRIVAARLTGVMRRSDLAPDLERALTAETDARISGEQVRSLLLLDEPAATSAVEQYVPHASVPGALAYAWWLVRAHPERMPDVVPTLANAMGHQLYRLLPVLYADARRAPAIAPRMFTSYVHDITAPAARSAIWNDLRTLHFDASFFRAALTSDRAAVREAAVWRLIDWLSDGTQLGDDVIQAAQSAPGAVTVSALTWEQFGREIVGREARSAVTPDRSAWLKAAAAAHQAEALLLGRLGSVTPAERDALRGALGAAFQTSPPAARRPMATSDAWVQTPMRTLPVLWPDLVTSVFKAAGCRTTKKHQYESVSVSYRPDGRINTLVTARDGKSTPCATAATALVRLLVADPEEPFAADVPQTILVPLQKDVVACMDQPDVDAPSPRDVTVPPVNRSPTVEQQVRPNYTDQARRDGVEGDVWMNATIGRTGCVPRVSIARTLDAGLDLNALDAAIHWRFNPFVVNGQPREVPVTIVLEFRLRK
jgi:TonB family protein